MRKKKFNKIIKGELVSKIVIPSKNQIHYCLIDTEDIEGVNQYVWRLKSDGVISTTLYENKCNVQKPKHRWILLSHFIMKKETSDKQLIKYINNNKLDNRKINLVLRNVGAEIGFQELLFLYEVKKQTVRQIATSYNVSLSFIFKLLKKFGIKTRRAACEKHSEETRKKWSLQRRGQHRSEDVRKKMSESKKGEKNPNYKYGKSKSQLYFNNLFRCAAPYKEWRKNVFEKDNYTCQKCFNYSRKNNPVYLEAHHIKSFNDFPELRLDINNGLTLCKKCHKKLHKNV